MSETVLTPTEALSALIERATSGEDVTAQELALANAAVQLAELQATGEGRREKKRAEEAAAKAREDAKAEAAKLLEGVNIGSLIKRYDAAVAALDGIVAETVAYNDAINTVGRTFNRGGLVPLGANSSQEEAMKTRSNPLFDRNNHVAWDYGNKVHSVVVDGETYATVNANPLVALAVMESASRHSGFPLPYTSSIQNRLDYRDQHNWVLTRRERGDA